MNFQSQNLNPAAVNAAALASLADTLAQIMPGVTEHGSVFMWIRRGRGTITVRTSDASWDDNVNSLAGGVGVTSLYAYVKGIDQAEATRQLAALLRLGVMAGEKKPFMHEASQETTEASWSSPGHDAPLKAEAPASARTTQDIPPFRPEPFKPFEPKPKIPASPSVTTTILQVIEGAATKTYNLDPEHRRHLVEIRAGVSKALAITTQGPLFDVIGKAGPQNVFVNGLVHRPDGSFLPPGGVQKIAVEALIRLDPKNYGDCVPRNLKNFKFPAGQPGVLLLDRDVYMDAYPTPQGNSTPQEFIDELGKIINLTGVAVMAIPSSSAGRFICEATGKTLRDKSGVHAYLALLDVSDSKRALTIIFKRMIIAGFGRAVISRAGRIYIKTLIDIATPSPERIDYVYAAKTGPGIRVENRAETVMIGGGCFDSKKLILDLTPEEEKAYKAEVERLKASVPEEEIDAVKAAYKAERVEEMVKKGRTTRAQAEKAVNDVVDGQTNRLPNEWLLETGDGSAVTVGDVLADPAAYAGVACYDPLDGASYGHTTAKVFVNPDGSVVLHSQAHGGQTWLLRPAGAQTNWEEAMNAAGAAGAASGKAPGGQAGPDPFAQAGAAASKSRLDRFQSYDGSAPPAPPPMLVKGLVPKQCVLITGGQSGAGKTYVAIHLTAALATVTPFFGLVVKEKVGVVILAAEGGGSVKARLHVAARQVTDEKELPIKWLTDVPNLRDAAQAAQLTLDLKEIDKTFREQFGVRLGMVIIDTVAAGFDLDDENANSEAASVLRIMHGMAETLNCVIMPVHHFGKNVTTGLRGASAWRAGADVVLSVTADRNEVTGEVSNHKVHLAKNRFGPESWNTGFELEKVILGQDEDGDDYSDCYVKQKDEAGAGKGGKSAPVMSPNAHLYMNCLATAFATGRNVFPWGVGGFAVFAAERETVRAEFYARFMSKSGGDSSDAKRQAFNRAEKELREKLGVIGCREVESVEMVWTVVDGERPPTHQADQTFNPGSV